VSDADNYSANGYWWVPAEPTRKLAGRLTYDAQTGPFLELARRFPNFQSYLSDDLGSPTARSVVLGTTSTGLKVSLMDVVEVSRSGPARKTKRTRERAKYNARLLVRRAHIRSWDELNFREVWIELHGLLECLGRSGFEWNKMRRPDDVRVTYRALKPLRLKLGRFGVVAEQWADFGRQRDQRQITERARLNVVASNGASYDELMRGPIATVRAVCEFVTAQKMPILALGGSLQHARGRWQDRVFGVDVLFAKGREEPPPLTSDDVLAFLFTFNEIDRRSLEVFVNKWHTARTSLSPMLEMFSALIRRPHLDAELRFLIVVYLLEAFHRLTRRRSRPSKATKALIEHLVSESPLQQQNRVAGLLGMLGAPSLHQRLVDLCRNLPSAFLNPFGPDDWFFQSIGPGPDFLTEVVNTRNYLTHLEDKHAPKALRDFPLYRASVRLEWLLRYLLLLHFGIRRSTAHAYVIRGVQAWPSSFSTLL
jgi:hypothetical protein